jgi:putrescine transport system substrate-binding protein
MFRSRIYVGLLLTVFGAVDLGWSAAQAQGIIPGKPGAEEKDLFVSDLVNTALVGLSRMEPLQIATIQRILRRLGYLSMEAPTRTLDNATVEAIYAHLAEAKIPAQDIEPERLLRSLFGMAWKKEGWSLGTASGQLVTVPPEQVQQAQEALIRLRIPPGPVDGIYGPATQAAVETFQEESGLKVDGVLSRNTFSNIARAEKFIDNAPASVLHVLNAPDNIDPAALERFEQATNIRVVHDTMDEEDETKQLLRRGTTRYDLMVHSGALMRQVLEKEGAALKIDRISIPNSNFSLDTAAQVYIENLDPGNAHSIPYLWGTTGLAVNVELVKKIRPDAPLGSMALILDPQYAADLAKCGIAVVDDPFDTVSALVSYVGGDYANVGITDIEAVDAAVAKVVDYIQVVPHNQFIDGLADGKYCVAFGRSGDAVFARDLAKQRNTGTIVYSVPQEGSMLWFDLFVIPGNAQNVDAAYKFIDHMLKPDVAGANTNFLKYANTVWSSTPYIDPNLLKEPAIYPNRNTLRRLTIQPPLSADVENAFEAIWDRLKKS